MHSARATVPRPLSPHPETLQDGRSLLTSADGTRMAVYCRRNHVGGCYFVEGEVWALYVPTTPGDTLAALRDNGFRFPARELVRTWLEHIAPPPAGHESDIETALDWLFSSANDAH